MINSSFFSSPTDFPSPSSEQAMTFVPNPNSIVDIINSLPPDPTIPTRNRPSTEVLLDRKTRMLKFWRPRNERMMEDEQFYKLQVPVEPRIGDDQVGASETMVLNDPYVIVEKISNMISSQDPVINVISQDPGKKEEVEKIRDFLRWWSDEANSIWINKLNNHMNRDEIYYLALRGWLAGRIMLDPGDPDFPYRYDLIDPIHVFPQVGNKGLNWVFHIYNDTKINILNDLGWNNDILQRIEETTKSSPETSSIEIASYYDDVWHVLFINDIEVWSAPHNYGFVPWQISICFGPPIRRTDPKYSNANSALDANNTGFSIYRSKGETGTDFTKWWGVSVFQGIKDVYSKLNKLSSAILTEAMKAPNPPVVVYTDNSGMAEGKTIDTSIGATSYLKKDQEDYKIAEFGFRPSELQPLMQLLTDARNRGSLPSVMYGEGANFMSGFAVNLLTSGARDLLYPLIKSHENYKQELFRKVLKLTANFYPFPIQMVRSNPTTGIRDTLTTITGDEIKAVGYRTIVYYKNIGPQDKNMSAQTAAFLVDKKIISLDTARGEEFLGLRDPGLENDKVLGEIAFFDQDTIKAMIPYSLLKTNPSAYIIYMKAQAEKIQMQLQQLQLSLQMGQGPNSISQNTKSPSYTRSPHRPIDTSNEPAPPPPNM